MRRLKGVLALAAAVLLLLGAAVLVAVKGSDHGDTDVLQTPPTQTSAAATQMTSATVPSEAEPAPTQTVQTEPPEPSETEPVKLTFSQDFSLLCRDYFIYQCGNENLMAVSGDPDEQMYPASITKLFTAYVALQYLQPETEVRAGDELDMVLYGSSVAQIGPGNVLTVAQLVEGMLLPSGNDAAYVLAAAAAREACGNAALSGRDAVARFVTMMNEEAAALGMTGTQFRNPDGYHDDEHYTTAADMITIAELALGNELIMSCAAIGKDEVTFASGQSVTWENTNLLISPESEYYCPEAVGLKTGKTNRTGYCLLSAFRVEGEYLIIGVFGCEEPDGRFADTLKLYQAAKEVLS